MRGPLLGELGTMETRTRHLSLRPARVRELAEFTLCSFPGEGQGGDKQPGDIPQVPLRGFARSHLLLANCSLLPILSGWGLWPCPPWDLRAVAGPSLHLCAGGGEGPRARGPG